MKSGDFTLPGEAGYEGLTLAMAHKWGADCIRDSDGTQLSEEILHSGIAIYSTLCMVRSVNQWARQNMDKLQRNFLSTQPVLAQGETLRIHPLDGFFREQFAICPADDPKEFWQVWDRTAETLHEAWSYDPQTETVTIENAHPFHLYTVSFLAVRIWEEISMYNHITNDWGEKEHLMAVEPRYPETQQALLAFLEKWLKEHPATTVVRFTSLFYNFVWLWGSDPRKRSLLSDWGSYDFTVNPLSLRAFQKEYGYAMTAEDFVNKGKYRITHCVPTHRQRDWMEFTGRFVREFGRQCVDLVHQYGKRAYVFYDDSWIGLEPWNGHFQEFGFDGLIKCVFNAFEARLCAGVKAVETHELRLHPYLFPTGLTGEPTFAPGGHPEKDVKRYWACVRRAMLRVKIDRIGLGGYLHLVEPFPAFQEEMTRIADEFRTLKALHQNGSPWMTGVTVGVLQAWGSIRTWNCAGHMHEHPELPLNHLYEAMAGQPFEVRVLSLEEVAANGVPQEINVLINAGSEGDAWSGGDLWKDPRLLENINRFVAKGGGLLGVKEPSAVRGEMRALALADVLGVEREIGQSICSDRYQPMPPKPHFILEGLTDPPAFANATRGVYALCADTEVLSADCGEPLVAVHAFGKGRAVYLAGFTYSCQNARLLYRTLLWLARKEKLDYLPRSVACECAYFPNDKLLVCINNTAEPVDTVIDTPFGEKQVRVEGEGIAFVPSVG
ncbi:MAG: 1,3-beta-galactosyl-N-acetylhexosamine phosphorylase [Eubacteriales bacterium]|nr:1,3-beta-galactosyl-N-acetylhexosamine phosphorylase [Eubacteriales bacterium]